MAGDWLKWTKGLARKREVMAIASKLGKDRLTIAAALMELWEWADSNTEDGHVSGVTIVTLQSVEAVTGLVTAMLDTDVAWLVMDADGKGVQFPHYDRHMGKSAKKRLSDSERQRLSRMNRDNCHNESVTKSVTREEKRREENINTPQTPKGAGGSSNPVNDAFQRTGITDGDGREIPPGVVAVVDLNKPAPPPDVSPDELEGRIAGWIGENGARIRTCYCPAIAKAMRELVELAGWDEATRLVLECAKDRKVVKPVMVAAKRWDNMQADRIDLNASNRVMTQDKGEF